MLPETILRMVDISCAFNPVPTRGGARHASQGMAVAEGGGLGLCSIYGPDSQTICISSHHHASYSGSSCAGDVQGSEKERNAVLLTIGMKM